MISVPQQTPPARSLETAPSSDRAGRRTPRHTIVAAILGIIGAALTAAAPSTGHVEAALWLAQAVWVVGNFLWTVYAARTRQWPLAAQGLCYLVISAYGAASWGQAVWRIWE